MTSTGQATRPDWTTMRAQDFDTAAPLTLTEAPTGPLTSTGDDLLALLGLPVVTPTEKTARPAPAAPVGEQTALF